MSNLPTTLPILPFSGALLLPRARLPLNIFEPRYLALVEDALSAGRLLGMVQPQDLLKKPSLYKVGCAGRIISFSETDDGRFLIVLQGVSRFAVGEEIATTRGYRRIVPDWQGYESDINETEEGLEPHLRDAVIDAIKPYFKMQGMVANWDTIEESTPERLISSIIAICPFADNEKQALLEAPALADRVQLLLTLLAMAVRQQPNLELARH